MKIDEIQVRSERLHHICSWCGEYFGTTEPAELGAYKDTAAEHIVGCEDHPLHETAVKMKRIREIVDNWNKSIDDLKPGERQFEDDEAIVAIHEVFYPESK